MSFLDSLKIAGSALTAHRFRIDTVAQNLANINTTRTEDGTPYARKLSSCKNATRPSPMC